MFVQVAVRNGEPAQVRENIVGVVQMALKETLGIDIAPILVRLADEPKRIQEGWAGGSRIAILVIAAEHFSAAKKRRLFGRIAEIARLELNLAHDEIITGVIETPAENWSNGYGERQWLQYLSYQLP
jgi:hypothetical protein